ncbi:Maf family nucleotide pyrophosphatase [Massilia sp. W12]|uniref:Maf family nucleotide pyrophosphatase n=1 Tax=Massilia sp. W12 TaxID=3126507 RepID=UPI0030CCE2AF
MSNPSSLPRLVLASGSAYRAELLRRLRLPFVAQAPDIDESALPGEAPEQTALRLAQAKAQHLAAQFPDSLIIGSDQVATLHGQRLSKPGAHAAALAQLQFMRGQTVQFHTALCLLDTRCAPAHVQAENITVTVRMRNLPDAELDAYLHLEQPYDCAGSAKNEGLGIALIEEIDNRDPSALTGLPLIALCSMLRARGMPFFGLDV